MTTSKPRSNDFVPAAEANRRFSELLRGVKEEGKTFTITSHGRPVAQVAPADADKEPQNVVDASDAAWARIEKRWATQPRLNIRLWTRDELYQRGQY